MFRNPDEWSCRAGSGGGKKLKETVDWQEVYAPQCEACKEVYGDDPDKCVACRPAYIEENTDAIRIFFQERNQLIMGFDGPIDINHLAIHEAMKLPPVKNPEECYAKVLVLANYWLSKVREKG